MPIPAIQSLRENQFVLHFETNNVIEIGQLCSVFSEIAHLAKLESDLGIDVKLILRRLESGSPTTTWIDVFNAIGAAAGVGSFGIGLANLIQENPNRKISRRVAELMLDNDVTELNIVVRDKEDDGLRHIGMSREMIPAVEAIQRRRYIQTAWPQLEQQQDRSVIVRERALQRKISNFKLDNGIQELTGRIVTTDGGRSAEFRTNSGAFKILSPDDLLNFAPIGEDIVVIGNVRDSERDEPVLELHEWRFSSDDSVDWKNRDGFPGVQAEKLRSLDRRASWRLPPSIPDILEVDEEEERMRAELEKLNDVDFASLNIETFVGRFAYDGLDRIFRTRSGTEYRIFSAADRNLGKEFLVRGYVVFNHMGARDWLSILDVFDTND